ncbi:MAG: hypothetical protein K2Y27_33860 [Xanthobacteraceae bacterium]|nr:hypothetical protein [Xanthobacteraceae bacterium]
MTVDRIFFGYMALVGLAGGALLVAYPAVGDFWLKPYFWVLIAVGVFDVGAVLRGQAPGSMLTMQARLLGFVIGVVALVVVPTLAGSAVKFF